MTSNSPPPNFVISLERAEERRGRFFAAAACHGWEVEIFPATDANDLRIDRISAIEEIVYSISTGEQVIDGRKRPDEGPDWISPGEYACAHSHFRLWQKLLDEDLGSICVFEDDAVVLRRFDLPPLPDDADFVFLSDRVSAMIPDQLDLEAELDQWIAENPFAPMVPGCGTECYIVTSQGAAKALELMDPMAQPLDRQLFACGSGTRLTRHELARYRPPTAPELALYASTTVYSEHCDFGSSYLR